MIKMVDFTWRLQEENNRLHGKLWKLKEEYEKVIRNAEVIVYLIKFCKVFIVKSLFSTSCNQKVFEGGNSNIIFKSFNHRLLNELSWNWDIMKLISIEKMTLFIIRKGLAKTLSLTLSKGQPHKMVKHIQTICRLLSTNCLSMFDHFVGLVLEGFGQ